LTEKKINIYLQYFIGLSVIVGLIYHTQSKENILPVLLQFNIEQISSVLIIICIHLLCLFFMWRIIVLSVGKIDPGYKMLLHSFFGGRTLGFITPGQTGELLKGMFFASGSRLKGTSLSMIFSGYNMLIRTILGSFACIYFILYIPDSLKMDENNTIYFIFFISMMILIFLLFYKGRVKDVIVKYSPQHVISLLKLLKEQLKSKSFTQFILLLVIALIANLLAAIAFMIVLLGFDIDALTFRGLMAFEAAYFAMSLLPITPAGIGVREGSRVYFFTLIGYDQTAVLCASFIIFVINIMLPAIIGIASMKYFWNRESDHI
jgi:uncharacterized membrane protein YbhN (UPF0104 family)